MQELILICSCSLGSIVFLLGYFSVSGCTPYLFSVFRPDCLCSELSASFEYHDLLIEIVSHALAFSRRRTFSASFPSLRYVRIFVLSCALFCALFSPAVRTSVFRSAKLSLVSNCGHSDSFTDVTYGTLFIHRNVAVFGVIIVIGFQR